jgi:hypothetical protein
LQWREDLPDFSVQQLFGFLGRSLSLSEEEVFDGFESMAAAHQAQLHESGKLDLGALGILSRDADGAITFNARQMASAFQPLPAARVIRQGALHHMMVGDTEKTNAEMEAYFAGVPAEKDRWWWLPLAIGIVAVALIIWKRMG